MMHITEQMQQLSFAYVHAVASKAGYACQETRVDDDSVDLTISARGLVGDKAILRSPKLDLQVKSTCGLWRTALIPFRLGMENYNDLRGDTHVPRLLVVLALPEKRSQWIEQTEDEMISRRCAYWVSLHGARDVSKSSITVYIPRTNQFTAAALRSLMRKIARRLPL